MTLNDLAGHSPVARLFKCNLTNICAKTTFYTVSTAWHGASRGPSATAELLVDPSYDHTLHAAERQATRTYHNIAVDRPTPHNYLQVWSMSRCCNNADNWRVIHHSHKQWHTLAYCIVLTVALWHICLSLGLHYVPLNAQSLSFINVFHCWAKKQSDRARHKFVPCLCIMKLKGITYFLLSSGVRSDKLNKI